jgi:hypothetical protein
VHRPKASQKQGIWYDDEQCNPLLGVQEFRRVLPEIGCHDSLWRYGCCRKNDPDQWCCDKRCAPNYKGSRACLAHEHFKSPEGQYCAQNTAQNLQASERPPEGRLIQRRAPEACFRSTPVKSIEENPLAASVEQPQAESTKSLVVILLDDNFFIDISVVVAVLLDHNLLMDISVVVAVLLDHNRFIPIAITIPLSVARPDSDSDPELFSSHRHCSANACHGNNYQSDTSTHNGFLQLLIGEKLNM